MFQTCRLKCVSKHVDARRVLKSYKCSGMDGTGFLLRELNFYDGKKGAVLGDHYHVATTEIFMVTKGSLRLLIRTIVSKQKKDRMESFMFNKGDAFVVYPYEHHTIHCLTDVSLVTALDKPFNNLNPDIVKLK